MQYEETEYEFRATVASREAVPALIGLWGPSGSGKTYSALLLARGLVGPKGIICVIDTENKRALFYSDVSPTWIHLDIQPPFTPDKYSKAFRYLRSAHKADIIIVDSMSHVWEGEGGILDMAENAKSAGGYALQGLAKWKNPKLAHKRMANDIMRSPVHVIFCLRQKDIMKTVKDEKGKEQYVFDRHLPIAEKNFVFEMTVALRLTKDGFYDAPIHPLYYKVPEGLKASFPPGAQINVAMGESVSAWLAGGTPVNPEISILADGARDAAEKGTAAYQKFWAEITPKQKALIQHMHLDFKNTAAEVDKENAVAKETERAAGLFKDKALPAAGGSPTPRAEPAQPDPDCGMCYGSGTMTDDKGSRPCEDCMVAAGAA